LAEVIKIAQLQSTIQTSINKKSELMLTRRVTASV